MLRIYPAIDIKGGKCVNLKQGKFDEMTVFGEDPAAIAVEWEKEGADYIHLVDLDGAKEGSGVNNSIVKKIREAVGVNLQLGGGIRTMQDIENRLETGVTRVILGTAAVNNYEFVKEAVKMYGSRIAVGVDAVNGIAATNAWLKVSGKNAFDLCADMAELGVKTIIYTDISLDGMMSGINTAATKKLADALKNVSIIASGGVSCLEDVKAAKESGAEGVIIGRALYNGAVKLHDAIELCKSPSSSF